MQMCNVSYRRAEKDDNIRAIAKYLYLTDPYIYPSVCDSYEDPEWIDLITQCFHDPENLFSQKNLYVALENDEIIGVCCIIPCGKRQRFAENLKIDSKRRMKMEQVIKGYFTSLLKESAEWDGYNVVNLCVDQRCRGKGIGTGLLDYCIRTCKEKPIYLDVLADNAGAIHVYRSLGFEIQETYKGFSGQNDSVLCYRMKKSK